MKAKPSGLISDLRGKFGNSVVVKNKHGLYIKPFIYPARSILASNRSVRLRMSLIAQHWQTLSSSVKNDWSTKALTYTFYDNLNTPYVPTGWQLYLYCQFNLTHAGAGFVDTPVNFHTVPLAAIATGTFHIGTTTFDATWSSPITAGYLLIFCCSRMLPSSSNAFIYPTVIVNTVLANTAQPLHLYSSVLSVLGSAPVVGNKFFFSYSAVELSTGLRSEITSELDLIAS